MNRIGFLLLLTVLISCDKNEVIDTSKNTANDPIADITWLGNSFYTTNYDQSHHAGPQIVLYRFSSDGQRIEDVFDLGLNGQGYLAITNDGTHLYLQSDIFNSIIKCSPAGEIYDQKWLIGDRDAKACGICYAHDQDSLCILLRNKKEEKPYKLLLVDKNNPANWHLKASASLNMLNEETGAYAIDLKNQELFILGQDTTDTDVLIRTTLALDVLDITGLGTDSTTGLCVKGDELYVGLPNKTIIMIE